MDTRSKSIKHSLFIKFICFVLAVFFFASAVINSTELIRGIEVVGFENAAERKEIDFFDTTDFNSLFEHDFYNLVSISQINTEADRKILEAEKPEMVKRILNNYLLERGKIIRDELIYVSNNWDEDYYAYEDEVEDFTSVSGDYSNSSDGIPANVKVAQEIVQKVKNPIDYNEYDYLVRDEAFSSDYYYSYNYPIDSEKGKDYNIHLYTDVLPYSYNKEQALEFITDTVDDIIDVKISDMNNNTDTEQHLQRLQYVNFYVKTLDNRTTSNVEKVPKNITEFKYFVYIKDSNIITNGFNDYLTQIFAEYSKDKKIDELCLFLEDDFSYEISNRKFIDYVIHDTAEDDYSRAYVNFLNITENGLAYYIVRVVVYLILALAFLIALLLLCGHKNGYDGIKTSFIDKLPIDIHIIVSSLLSIAFPFFMLCCGFSDYYSRAYMSILEYEFYDCVTAVLFAIAFIELFCSIARIKKSGQKLYKRTIIYILGSFVNTKGKRVFNKLKAEIGYKPNHFKRQVILGILGYFFVNACIVALFILTLTASVGFFCIIPIWIFVAFNSLICYYVVKYVNTLDKIIVASENGETVLFNEIDTPKSLLALAKSLETTNEELQQAVEEAVKNEQMKTQLITNVSHDLKTPLTSLINYSDLLTKCDIKDEQAVTYINVINTQSEKLKRLIEDLIEASKVSTGNVRLNKTTLNLHELCVQAIVEFTPEFEKNNIDVIFSEPEDAVYIYADGTKTYRIISNLLSNVKKYSAPYSRAYVTIFKDENYGMFEVKNVSKEQLNISPDQLTERFVRGDESRTKDGNGLGLSIAKDLCSLQEGALDIVIDGDLFKVKVKMPIAEFNDEEKE